MKHFQNSFSSLAALVIVALVAVGAGVVLSQNIQTQTPSASLPQTSALQTPPLQAATPSSPASPSSASSPASSSGTSGISVPGMSQYTDAAFGFSFWYPTSWTVQDPSSQKSYLAISGGTIGKTIMVGPAGDLDNSILVQEFASSDLSIMDSSDPGPAGNGPGTLVYRFDPTIHSWTVQYNAYGGSMSTKVLTTFTDSMGGLHILGGNARFGDDVIIPLSATHFLVVSAVDAGTIQERTFAETITATDPAVATPVSASQQAMTIHTEGLLYGTLGRAVNGWYVDSQYVYTSSGAVIPGADPATFRVITVYSDGYVSPGTEYATDGVHVYSSWGQNDPLLVGADPATFVPIRQAYQIAYGPTSGKYGQSFTSYDTDFAKDATHVWYAGKLIPGADPSTLVVTGNMDVVNSSGGYTLAHDARHSYGVDAQNNITIDGVSVAQ